MSPDKNHSYPSPSSFDRRILLCLTGMTPQIVTETLYVLAVQRNPPWIPTEIHLITTSEGEKIALETLFDPEKGQLWNLFRDYGLPEIPFKGDFIYILRDRHGRPLSDIRSDKDNEDAANFIEDIVRSLTMDMESSLHLSLAGGRKTLGFYAGYALSLFGRPQDSLSHVLVSRPIESLPDFYYPPPKPVLVHSRFNNGELFDTQDAVVTLASIPFVRLRHVLPDLFLATRKSFHEAVIAAQKSLPSHRLHLDLPNLRLLAGDQEVHLSPTELAFMSWVARRKKLGKEPLICPKGGIPRLDYAQEYLQELKSIRGEMGDIDRTERALRKGMDQEFFEQKRSRINSRLKRLLKVHATPYQIRNKGARGMPYGIAIREESIVFGPLPLRQEKTETLGNQTDPTSTPQRGRAMSTLTESDLSGDLSARRSFFPK